MKLIVIKGGSTLPNSLFNQARPLLTEMSLIEINLYLSSICKTAVESVAED